MSMRAWPRSESEMLESAVAWLRSEGWDVFQEVELYAASGVCDIVAKRNGVTMAVEGKLGLGLDVLGQAWLWRDYADAVAVAVPGYRLHGFGAKGRGPLFAKEAAREMGLGVLGVHRDGKCGPRCRWSPEPVVWDQTEGGFGRRLDSVLHDEHRDFAPAGGANGKRLTPFSLWRRGVVAHVTDNPGCTAHEIAAAVPHHYSGEAVAAAQVHRWCSEFGLDRDESVRPYQFKPKESPDE